ncbi:pectinesterase family protein [Catellatospora tritici]|uniref:pectinesterase family protein n=1 Tax=Catellatospora tritici TaxID=2851566 RepID=UPI001C2CEEFD|nr:pectinesterase family protein [Catellatospora tritici]MBV1850747.1 RICIN domain-containing protein [Catellatospora tritici]MBV1851000.1 RICIN domain-containing protein [Catellatospora tritici]
MTRTRAIRPLPAALALVVVASATALLLPATSQAAVAPVAGGVYTLVPGVSGKCVEVPGSSTASGTKLTQAACAAGATRQQWRVVANSGKFQLVNINSGMCVDVPGASTTSGTQLQQWGCAAQTNQLWTFTASSAASGKYLVVSAATAQCVSDKDGSTAGNNPIVQESCADIARMQIAFNLVGTAPSTPPGTPTVATDGTGQYTSVQAAINAVPSGNTSRRVITIKAGTYRETVVIPTDRPYVTLQGLGSSAGATVIVNNHNAADGSANNGSTITVFGHDFAATNLTVSNDYGIGVQALALNLNVDRGRFDNIRLLGNQDTLLVNNSARVYFVNSYVEGTVDFIYGGGIAVFNACQIYEKRTTGGPITAASTPADRLYGILIYKSTVSGATANTTQLGRPWRQDAQVLYRESTLTNTIKTAQPWTDMSTSTWQNARFLEYRNTGAGAGVNSNRPQLSDAQAANYTPQKYLAGSDGWNPI